MLQLPSLQSFNGKQLILNKLCCCIWNKEFITEVSNYFMPPDNKCIIVQKSTCLVSKEEESLMRPNQDQSFPCNHSKELIMWSGGTDSVLASLLLQRNNSIIIMSSVLPSDNIWIKPLNHNFCLMVMSIDKCFDYSTSSFYNYDPLRCVCSLVYPCFVVTDGYPTVKTDSAAFLYVVLYSIVDHIILEEQDALLIHKSTYTFAPVQHHAICYQHLVKIKRTVTGLNATELEISSPCNTKNTVVYVIADNAYCSVNSLMKMVVSVTDYVKMLSMREHVTNKLYTCLLHHDCPWYVLCMTRLDTTAIYSTTDTVAYKEYTNIPNTTEVVRQTVSSPVDHQHHGVTSECGYVYIIADDKMILWIRLLRVNKRYCTTSTLLLKGDCGLNGQHILPHYSNPPHDLVLILIFSEICISLTPVCNMITDFVVQEFVGCQNETWLKDETHIVKKEQIKPFSEVFFSWAKIYSIDAKHQSKHCDKLQYWGLFNGKSSRQTLEDAHRCCLFRCIPGHYHKDANTSFNIPVVTYTIAPPSVDTSPNCHTFIVLPLTNILFPLWSNWNNSSSSSEFFFTAFRNQLNKVECTDAVRKKNGESVFMTENQKCFAPNKTVADDQALLKITNCSVHSTVSIPATLLQVFGIRVGWSPKVDNTTQLLLCLLLIVSVVVIGGMYMLRTKGKTVQ